MAVSLRSSIAKRRSHLNAALVCKRKNAAIARSSGKSSKLKLSYRRSISVLTSVVKIQNWHRFNG
ncbi:TPA: hypothetical protein I7703_21100 [Vibrio vulnificus]|nr:hypothetical protein [Vibrio vulnificus]POC29339.1 hypothetical protein CRN60_01000 [Vibrio vulnificus]RZP72455.1 hypothetical protein D8T60_22990 [Vibrio vulnificus]RZQ30997.1 hypothetical protein D8T38_22025 [Vibrio vulnificus]RZQ71687.1 hypothetical protein D8T22_22130 [Vibrio vulnificus]